MKKFALSTLLISAGVLGMSVLTFAEDPEVPFQDRDNVTYESDLSIKFEKETGSNTEGPYSGRLTFTYAPKNYKFGSQKIKFGTGVNYDLESASKDSQYIVVNEDRKDDDENFGKVWNVNVSMSELSAGAGDTLPATLTLGLGDLQKYNIGTALNSAGDDLDPAKPWDEGVMTPYDDKENTAPADVILGGNVDGQLGRLLEIKSNGQDVQVMAQNKVRTGDARKREGWGTKVTSQNLKFVTLDTSVADKEYTSKLTWTLTRDIK